MTKLEHTRGNLKLLCVSLTTGYLLPLVLLAVAVVVCKNAKYIGRTEICHKQTNLGNNGPAGIGRSSKSSATLAED
jgi:hypothetical protein